MNVINQTEPTTSLSLSDSAGESTGTRVLLLILGAGLLVRLLLLGWFAGEPLNIDDEREYNTIAVNLVEHGSYASHSGEPTSIRPPLYPAMVAGIYRLFGRENYQAVRAVQIFMGLVVVVLVYMLARRMFSARVGLWAAAICCFYPSLLSANCLLLTETLFSLLLCLVCLTLWAFFNRGSVMWLVALGCVLGLAALTRSVVWLFPPFLVVFLLWASRSVPWPRRVVVAFIPVVAFCATIAPWSIRNTQLQKIFTTIDVMGGRNFMMGNYEHTPLFRAWDAIGITGDLSWHAVLAAEDPNYGQMTQGQRDKLAMRRTIGYVLKHPGLTAQRCVIKFFNFWQLERSMVAGLARGWWGNVSTPVILGMTAVFFGSYVFVILAGVYGFVLTRSTDQRMDWFLLLLVGFVCAVHTAVFGHSRYHLPLMPLVCIYAAWALVNVPSIWERKRAWSFGLATGVCAVLVSSWLWEVFVVDFERFRSQVLS